MPLNLARISVLLPLRNEGHYLEECLDSLRMQTFRDFEVIAIDDGSSDDTAPIFGSTARRDARFHLYPARGKGIVSALNQAAEIASTPLLARMDGDDVCCPERLEKQFHFLAEHPEIAVVGSLVDIFPKPLSMGMERYENWLNSLVTHDQMSDQRFVESPLAHPSVLIRREAFNAIGGYQALRWPEDYDLWLRLLESGYRLAKVPESLLKWRDTAHRTSRTSRQYSPEAFRNCKLEYLERFAPLHKGCAILGAGPTAKPWARLLAQRGIAVRCFVDLHPRRIGKSIQGLPVVAYDDLPKLDVTVFLAAVGKKGGRGRIVEWFRCHPLKTGQMLVLVA